MEYYHFSIWLFSEVSRLRSFYFPKEKQGNFYRYMEADVLKHNCIAYLLQDYPLSEVSRLRSFYFPEAKENQGNFYRYMEADVLKHNCIAYLLQDYLNVLGQNFTNGETMPTFEVILGEQLDQYTALAKFMEQALEWEIMDYTFYPYYWANREKWQENEVSPIP